MISGNGVHASFVPSISSANNTFEINVPFNSNVSISYFDDAGVFINSSRVITQQILDDTVATLMMSLRKEFHELINSTAQQEAQSFNYEYTSLYNTDMKLNSTLASEAFIRSSADSMILNKLSAEASSQVNAILNLDNELTVESSLRTSADSREASDLSAESSSRAIADKSLSADLVTESSNRANADLNNALALLVETSRATIKEASLSAMDSSFINLANLSVLNAYVDGRIILGTFCQSSPRSPLQFGSHEHCAGTASGITCTPICNSGFAANASYLCGTGGVWIGNASCVLVRCPVNGGSAPQCSCLSGYSGTLSFSLEAKSWSGVCTVVNCPANGGTGPACACASSFTGSLMFSNQTQAWSGTCLSIYIFSIFPSVNGKSSWNIFSDGPLLLSTFGTYKIVPGANISLNAYLWGAGGGSNGVGGNGGSGGFARGTVLFQAGISYDLLVGSGGTFGVSNRASSGFS